MAQKVGMGVSRDHCGCGHLQADLGIVFDTDVDRSAVVASSGDPINSNKYIALMSYIALRSHTSPLSCSPPPPLRTAPSRPCCYQCRQPRPAFREAGSHHSPLALALCGVLPACVYVRHTSFSKDQHPLGCCSSC